MTKSDMLYLFLAALILIIFYSLYIQLHQQASWTLIFPLLIVGIISRSHYKYRIYKKRCLARCFLVPGTWPYRVMHGRVFSLIMAVVISVVYAASLMSFMALNSWPGLWYAFMSFILIALFYLIIYPGAVRWISAEISHVVALKVISWLCFLVMIPIYLWIAFNTPIPDYVDPDSLSATIANATSQVGALCPVTNFFVKASHELEAIFFYFSVSSSMKLEQNWIKFLIWSLFFIKSSLVFLAMNRFNTEILLMAVRFGKEQQSQPKNIGDTTGGEVSLNTASIMGG